MNTEQKIALLREVGEEIITEEELKTLLEEKKHPIAYDGFEPSGNIHIAQALIRSINVNKLLKAGIKFIMLAADWHAWANNKLGADLEKIETAGNYLIEVWKASGMDTSNVTFKRSNDIIHNPTYWKTVMRIAQKSSLKRIIRCSQIMGRKEHELLQASQILYPCMQCADIFELNADITQLGMDQRKVNIIAREIGPSLGFWKPVIISHHMLLGLQHHQSTAQGVERAIEMKMSKSQPNSAIFITDTPEQVDHKIMSAYCPAGISEENPILEYLKHIVFEKQKNFTIERDKKYGGDLTFASYKELETAYTKKQVHPEDLKKATARSINQLLQPIQLHFEKNKKARDLRDQVLSYAITR